MHKREVVKTVLDHKTPPYVPWHFGFTVEAKTKLREHFGTTNTGSEAGLDRGLDLDEVVGNHFVRLGSDIGFFKEVSPDMFEDVFGVVWDRSIDKDIGNVSGQVVDRPTLKGYQFPDPLDERFFKDIPGKLTRFPNRFRVFQLGFSLYERAWSLRGMEQLMMDFYDNPGFVHELFGAIGDYNIAQVKKAMTYDIDAVYFGDDWGQQRGLQMGPDLWMEYFYPVLKRMYGAVKEEGKYVMIHSCGDVDELFDLLINIGLDCFNPFQPEVMDIKALHRKYKDRLSFHGGLSTQQTLPYHTAEEVRRESRELLDMGSRGGYIFSPAHDVEGDVPLENMLAFIDMVQSQISVKK